MWPFSEESVCCEYLYIITAGFFSVIVNLASSFSPYREGRFIEKRLRSSSEGNAGSSRMILKPKDGNTEDLHSLQKQRAGSSSSKMNSLVSAFLQIHIFAMVFNSVPFHDTFLLLRTIVNVIEHNNCVYNTQEYKALADAGTYSSMTWNRTLTSTRYFPDLFYYRTWPQVIVSSKYFWNL